MEQTDQTKQKQQAPARWLVLILGLSLGWAGAKLPELTVTNQISQALGLLERQHLEHGKLREHRQELADEAISGLVIGAKLISRDKYIYYLNPAQAREEDEDAKEVSTDEQVTTRDLGQGLWLMTVPSFFSDDINDQLRNAMKRIGNNKPKGLIIDLRGNTGGFMDAGVVLAGLIISPGELIDTRIRNNTSIKDIASGQQAWVKNVPIRVLVDGATASASEIAAAALQSQGVKLIGEKTRGKARVQDAYDLSGGGRLVMTTERWLTPSGIDIQDKGLIPDIKTETKDALKKAIEDLS